MRTNYQILNPTQLVYEDMHEAKRMNHLEHATNDRKTQVKGISDKFSALSGTEQIH